MRIDLFRKLDTLAPAYLVRRRSGDLIALANQDIETIEYFFAHTVAPALVAVLVPATVLRDPRRRRLADRLGIAAVRPLRRSRAGADAGADRPARRRRRATRSGCSAPMSPRRSRASPTSSPSRRSAGRRRRLYGRWCAAISGSASDLLRDLSSQTAQLEIVTGLGGLAVAVVGARLAAEHQLDGDHLAAADPAGAGLVPADLGDRPGQPPARRHDRLDPPLLRRAAREAGGASTARCARRRRSAARRSASSDVGFAYPGRPPAGAERCRARRSRPARRWRWSARRAPARRRSPTCCCASGTRAPGGS